MSEFDGFVAGDLDNATTSGQANVKQRKDFQPSKYAPSISGCVPANKAVTNPLFRAREQALQVVEP
jgi:hypothetical protein